MQSPEYDKLFNQGLASLPKLSPIDLMRQQIPMIADLRQMPEAERGLLKTLAPEEAREIIAQHEEPMSEAMQIKIKTYIDRRRKAGASEKAIRKAVMKKFGITVV